MILRESILRLDMFISGTWNEMQMLGDGLDGCELEAEKNRFRWPLEEKVGRSRAAGSPTCSRCL
jgi:hypothetical protein